MSRISYFTNDKLGRYLVHVLGYPNPLAGAPKLLQDSRRGGQRPSVVVTSADTAQVDLGSCTVSRDKFKSYFWSTDNPRRPPTRLWEEGILQLVFKGRGTRTRISGRFEYVISIQGTYPGWRKLFTGGAGTGQPRRGCTNRIPPELSGHDPAGEVGQPPAFPRSGQVGLWEVKLFNESSGRSVKFGAALVPSPFHQNRQSRRLGETPLPFACPDCGRNVWLCGDPRGPAPANMCRPKPLNGGMKRTVFRPIDAWAKATPRRSSGASRQRRERRRGGRARRLIARTQAAEASGQ